LRPTFRTERIGVWMQGSEKIFAPRPTAQAWRLCLRGRLKLSAWTVKNLTTALKCLAQP